MKPKDQKVQIGIFVAVGILLFAFSLSMITSDEGLFSSRVRVHSYFKDTQGLMFGSEVSFSGINIGNVKNIKYDSKRKALKVEYTIKESFLPFIKKDATAQLKTQGALGDRFVFIEAGSPDTQGIEPGEEIQGAKSNDIFSAVQEKINGLPDFERLSKKIESIVDFLNSEEGLVGGIKELRLSLIEAKTLLKDIRTNSHPQKSLKKLESVLSKIDSGEGTIGKLISDPGLYEKISGLLGSKQNTSDYLKEMARKSIEQNEEKSK